MDPDYRHLVDKKIEFDNLLDNAFLRERLTFDQIIEFEEKREQIKVLISCYLLKE